MDAWTYDKIDEAIKILDEISHSLKRLADYYTPKTETADTPQTEEEINILPWTESEKPLSDCPWK